MTMETLLITLIVMSIILFGALTITQRSLAAQEALAESWREMEERLEQSSRTDLAIIGVQGQGSTIEITVKNTGDGKLADFQHWDCIVHYYAVNAYLVKWLPYLQTPQGWRVLGIYSQAAEALPEVQEPGVLNPGEEMVIQTSLLPPLKADTVGLTTITTSNGISISSVFQAN